MRERASMEAGGMCGGGEESSPSGSEFASEETRYAGNGPDYSYGSYAQTPSRAPKYRYLLMT